MRRWLNPERLLEREAIREYAMQGEFNDEWGHDPQVQTMRQAFSGMEAAHDILLTAAGISWRDPLRRRFQKAALHLFERGYGAARRLGLTDGISAMADFYALCLARVLASGGYSLSDDVLPGNPHLRRLFQEVTP